MRVGPTCCSWWVFCCCRFFCHFRPPEQPGTVCVAEAAAAAGAAGAAAPRLPGFVDLLADFGCRTTTTALFLFLAALLDPLPPLPHSLLEGHSCWWR